MTYGHRTNPADPCTDFSYDNLDRLRIAEYGIQDNNEVFTMDDLGNRTNVSGTVLERYEYDAYGNCNVLDNDFSDDSDGISGYNNPYLFTGRRVDILDTCSLKIQYSRNRYYDYYAGRWLSHDPLGE